MISGQLLEAAKCNAVLPYCSNKTNKQYIHNVHYTDKFQLNVIVTHNTFIILMILLNIHYVILSMVQLLFSYVPVYIDTNVDLIYCIIKFLSNQSVLIQE